MDQADPIARVLAYHRRTKHHPARYARALGYLDWDNQPDPFRTYAGAPRVELPLAADLVTTRYSELFEPGAVPARALDLVSLGAFFELALGLTAWKELEGHRWALRADPSSGNLHPTEGYALFAGAEGLAAGLYHYVSRDHALELRCRLAPGPAAELARALPAGGFLVGIASIHWREAWKYGERAFRYCQHDAGHVIATVGYAAGALGWRARLLEGLGERELATLLGLDRAQDVARIDEQDREQPDCALLVAPFPPRTEEERRAWIDPERPRQLGTLLAGLLARGEWAGLPNPLSAAHVAWDVIDDVALASAAPAHAALPAPPRPALPALRPATTALAATLIRQRRSAVQLDRVTTLAESGFYALLDAVLARDDVPPWSALPWRPRIHLGIFVHRVDGLAPGLYLLERDEAVHAQLVAALGPRARWTRPPRAPQHLRLFCIDEVDCRRASAAVSCQQDIAADGAFSLGMLAELADTLAAGAHGYRRLFWEAGALGQVLYLEAEAAGLRGTGIGCYFDDAFHQVLGLSDERLQSLYHFTLGGPVDDPRLVTHAPYAHLGARPGPARLARAGDPPASER